MPKTVQGWSPNHKSVGAENAATSGMTARSIQPTVKESVSRNQNPEAFLLPGGTPTGLQDYAPSGPSPLRRIAHCGVGLLQWRASTSMEFRIYNTPLQVSCRA